MASSSWRTKKTNDSELIESEQGLLLFTPNLQSFGALPRNGLGTSSIPPYVVDERAA